MKTIRTQNANIQVELRKSRNELMKFGAEPSKFCGCQQIGDWIEMNRNVNTHVHWRWMTYEAFRSTTQANVLDFVPMSRMASNIFITIDFWFDWMTEINELVTGNERKREGKGDKIWLISNEKLTCRLISDQRVAFGSVINQNRNQFNAFTPFNRNKSQNFYTFSSKKRTFNEFLCQFRWQFSPSTTKTTDDISRLLIFLSRNSMRTVF